MTPDRQDPAKRTYKTGDLFFLRSGDVFVAIGRKDRKAKISDRVIVLDHGEKIADGKVKDVLSDERIAQVYLDHGCGIEREAVFLHWRCAYITDRC